MVYIISLDDENIKDVRSMVYAGESEDKALEAFALTFLTKNKDFIDYIYFYGCDGLADEFFDVMPNVGEPHTEKSIASLRNVVSDYFAGNQHFTQIYLDFLLAWHPLDLTEMDSDARDKAWKEITVKMKDYQFPPEMILFVAKKEAHKWYKLQVTEVN